MNYIDNIIETTINSFDISFCISVNVLTYMIIQIMTEAIKPKKISIWYKRLIMVLSVIFVSMIYYFSGIDNKLIVNSAILAPVFWSWIGKPIVNKLGIDYK